MKSERPLQFRTLAYDMKQIRQTTLVPSAKYSRIRLETEMFGRKTSVRHVVEVGIRLGHHGRLINFDSGRVNERLRQKRRSRNLGVPVEDEERKQVDHIGKLQLGGHRDLTRRSTRDGRRNILKNS